MKSGEPSVYCGFSQFEEGRTVLLFPDLDNFQSLYEIMTREAVEYGFYLVFTKKRDDPLPDSIAFTSLSLGSVAIPYQAYNLYYFANERYRHANIFALPKF